MISAPLLVLFLATLALTLVVLGAIENYLHAQRLKAIDLRIHVNGTRGKSSVTRLIAAGLREAGYVTVAKTTGSLPRLIMPDARELAVARNNSPNVLEQRDVVALAVRHRAQALVVECMALQPRLQWLCESKLIKATHAIITNSRPDHLDVMGPDEVGVAQALCGMVPPDGAVFVAEHKTPCLSVMAHAAQDRGAKLTVAYAKEAPGSADGPKAHAYETFSGGLSDDTLATFSYVEHADNIAVALALLMRLGIARDVALLGMAKAKPDAGALMAFECHFFGRDVTFVNGFAANDPVSTLQIWQHMKHRFARRQSHIALINCRHDRIDRSLQLGCAIAHWPKADRIVLMGTGQHAFVKAARRAGVADDVLMPLGDKSAAEIFEFLLELVDEDAMIMGLGNIGGQGLSLVRLFRNRSDKGAA